MKRIFAATVALAALSACGDGNPFSAGQNPGDGSDPDAFVIPQEVAGTVTNFTYNPSAGELTLTGLLRDGDETTVTYRRRAALDQGVYQAYTFQDDPLDEHTTVYVRERGDVAGAVAVTGGQFTYYSGGTNFRRVGAYDPIVPSEANDRGLVTYAGEYIGLSNLNGPRTDLLAPPAVDPDAVGSSVQPAQASVVNGRVLINVEFATNELAGEVYDRVIDSERFGRVAIPDLIIVPTTMNDDGTFVAEVELPGSRQDVGGAAGIIGGQDSDVLAGGLFAEEHFADSIAVGGEEEYGLFVLGRCGGPQQDPSTECSVVDPE